MHSSVTVVQWGGGIRYLLEQYVGLDKDLITKASMMDEEEGKTVDSDGSNEDEGEEGDVVGRKKK